MSVVGIVVVGCKSVWLNCSLFFGVIADEEKSLHARSIKAYHR